MIQRISGGVKPLVATIDNNRYKSFASVNNLVLLPKYENLYNYILLLLNSDLLNFYYSYSFTNKSSLTVNISKTFLESLPISTITEKILQLIDNKIHQLSTNLDDNNLIQDLNSLIYSLYDINEKELKLINKNLKH